jgi:hypothetical protein
LGFLPTTLGIGLLQVGPQPQTNPKTVAGRPVCAARSGYEVSMPEKSRLLRGIIDQASSGDIIRFANLRIPWSIALNPDRGELILNKNLTIEATSAQTVKIYGAKTLFGDIKSRVFEVSAGVSVNLSYLRLNEGNGLAGLSNGTQRLDGRGGAVLDLGTLTKNACGVTRNSASLNGGGMYVADGARLTVRGISRLNENSAPMGGGIYDDSGTLTIDGSLLATDSAQEGGGVYNAFGTVAK